jgi:predicted nucleic acid-binding protein
MRRQTVVVADTDPLHYLVLIGDIALLPQLFETVFVPEAVRDELTPARTPPAIRDWLATRPTWLEPLPAPPMETMWLPKLGDGERAAIALAISLHADLILMDDRGGVAAARAQGLEAIGTLGLLDLAARRGLINLAEAVERLKSTNFRYDPTITDALLAQHSKRKP